MTPETQIALMVYAILAVFALVVLCHSMAKQAQKCQAHERAMWQRIRAAVTVWEAQANEDRAIRRKFINKLIAMSD